MRSIPFANSLAAVTGLFALALFGLRFIAPRLFVFVFNSQFFGADVASLLRPERGVGPLIGALAVVVLTTWIFGLVWALLYNQWTGGRR